MKLETLHDFHRKGTATALASGPQGEVLLEVLTYAPTERGKQLREARRAAGLNLEDVARLFGISTADASGLEHGHKELSAEEWDAMLRHVKQARSMWNWDADREGWICGDPPHGS